MYWWLILDSRDNYDWNDSRHSVEQIGIFWARDEQEAKRMAKKWGFHETDMAGKFKTISDARKSWKQNQAGNKPHKHNEIDFAVKDGKMMKGKDIHEAYKVHYPSLKKLASLEYTDPRVNTEGKKIHVEKEGTFKSGDSVINGHYVVYEDAGMPGSFIGVHIGSEINEESGEAPVSVVAIDTNRRSVMNRVAYRARQSAVAESSVATKELDLTKRVLTVGNIGTVDCQVRGGRLGEAYRGRPSNASKERHKADWMGKFENHVNKLDPSTHGKVDWNAAHFHYNSGADPVAAAEKHIGARTKKEGREITEATKSKYEIFHDSFTSAVGEAKEYAEKNGYDVRENDWFNYITVGRGRPKDGQTFATHIGLEKNGVAQKKSLHIQVYNRETHYRTYELNCYIS